MNAGYPDDMPAGAATFQAFECLKGNGLIANRPAGTYVLTDAGRAKLGLESTG